MRTLVAFIYKAARKSTFMLAEPMAFSEQQVVQMTSMMSNTFAEAMQKVLQEHRQATLSARVRRPRGPLERGTRAAACPLACAAQCLVHRAQRKEANGMRARAAGGVVVRRPGGLGLCVLVAPAAAALAAGPRG